jgi:hypothetical protein
MMSSYIGRRIGRYHPPLPTYILLSAHMKFAHLGLGVGNLPVTHTNGQLVEVGLFVTSPMYSPKSIASNNGLFILV